MRARPFAIEVEFVEGCNRYCDFCGLRSIRAAAGEDLLEMDLGLAGRIAEKLAAFAPTARYEFAGHGEPLVHSDYLGAFRAFREALPDAQFQVTTNGKRLRGKMRRALRSLFEIVDIVMLDTYEPERLSLIEEATSVSDEFNVVDFYASGGVPSPWHNHRRKLQRTVIVVDDLGVRSGEVKTRTIYNAAGHNRSAPIPLRPLRRTCALPFRSMFIRYNGAVPLCCEDWGAEFECGSVAEAETADEVWSGPAFEAARRVLQSRSRGFNPCRRCNVPAGARIGLLPKLPAPTSETVEEIRRVHESSPNALDRESEIDFEVYSR